MNTDTQYADRRPLLSVKGLRKRAIVIGIVVSMVVGVVIIRSLLYKYGGYLLESGLSESEMLTEISSRFKINLITAVGLIGTVLGGYTAGRFSNNDFVRHALFTGIAIALFGVVMTIVGDSQAPKFDSLIFSLLHIPSAFLGGVLCKWQMDNLDLNWKSNQPYR